MVGTKGFLAVDTQAPDPFSLDTGIPSTEGLHCYAWRWTGRPGPLLGSCLSLSCYRLGGLLRAANPDDTSVASTVRVVERGTSGPESTGNRSSAPILACLLYCFLLSACCCCSMEFVASPQPLSASPSSSSNCKRIAHTGAGWTAETAITYTSLGVGGSR